jgi:hypothetical protein
MPEGYIPPGFISIRDAAELTGLPRSTPRRMIDRLGIEVQEVDRNHRVKLISLEDMEMITRWRGPRRFRTPRMSARRRASPLDRRDACTDTQEDFARWPMHGKTRHG